MEFNPAGQRVVLTEGGTAAAGVGSKIWSIGLNPAAADAVLTLREDSGSGAVIRIIRALANAETKDLQFAKAYGRPGVSVVHATVTGVGAIAYISFDA